MCISCHFELAVSDVFTVVDFIIFEASQFLGKWTEAKCVYMVLFLQGHCHLKPSLM